MGQQQLLLVILVTILVGIATVVGINVFGTSAVNANHDAVRNDIAQIASSSQGWYIKPRELGGGGNSFKHIGFQDITFPGEISADTLVATNLNGEYELTAHAENGFKITATPSSSDDGTDFFEGIVTEGGLEIGALNAPMTVPTEE
jgi:hypothetical protein